MILIKCILLSLLISSLIYHLMVYKEPISLECCGRVVRGAHFTETDTSPPRIIRRCFEDDSDWDPMPCTGLAGSSNCCKDLAGPCVPTNKGGYCGSRKNPINARTGNKMPDSEVGGIVDVSDERSVGIGENRGVVVNRRQLQENRLQERRQILKETQYSGEEYSNITYSIEKYNRYTAILWLYILHIFFILVLMFLLRNEINRAIAGYLSIFQARKQEFSTK